MKCERSEAQVSVPFNELAGNKPRCKEHSLFPSIINHAAPAPFDLIHRVKIIHPCCVPTRFFHVAVERGGILNLGYLPCT